MNVQTLPDTGTMYEALVKKDTRFEGIFFAAIKTTGIFCRPSCTARKPRPENVEYFAHASEAIRFGYRPCKVCHPMTLKDATPGWLEGLLKEISADPALRFKNADLEARGLQPERVSRWFKKTHGITFQAYLRMLRINNAFGQIKYGERVTDTAFGSGYESLSGFADTFKKTTGFAPTESPHKKIITVSRLLTPLGPMLAGATDEGICLLEFTDRRMLETQIARLKKHLKAEVVPGEHPHFKALDEQLKLYFEGKLKNFDLPLVLPGSDFQKNVWSELQRIPLGTTRSYKQQAENIGNPKAVRAVAKANGDNRIAIIVPCHRVIGSDGQLTGYGGGLWRKQWLLEHEQK